MKHYCVVYLSPGGMHYHYPCYAMNKREARKMCREVLGKVKIVEVHEERW